MDENADPKISKFLAYLLSLPYNKQCGCCRRKNPVWATVTYSLFICYDCAARHRQYGASVSRVKSVLMDSWSLEELRRMSVGGNRLASMLPSTEDFSATNKKCEEHVKNVDKLFKESEKEKPGESFMERGVHESNEFSGTVQIREKPRFGSKLRRESFVPDRFAEPTKEQVEPIPPESTASECSEEVLSGGFQPSRNVPTKQKPRKGLDSSRSPFSFISKEEEE